VVHVEMVGEEKEEEERWERRRAFQMEAMR
jgi:hypothetical protein